MGLFNWLSQKPATEETSAPEVKETDFIDVEDPNGDGFTTRVIDYGTGYPIDAIYSYIEKDWEEQGRNDAAANSELSYMNTKIELIRQGLTRRFDLITLQYQDRIRQVETRKSSLNALGLLSSMDSCNAYIKTCNEHIDKINALQKAFVVEDASLMSMIESYKRGFAMGVANQTSELIQQK